MMKMLRNDPSLISSVDFGRLTEIKAYLNFEAEDMEKAL
jgi:hypothetical protein